MSRWASLQQQCSAEFVLGLPIANSTGKALVDVFVDSLSQNIQQAGGVFPITQWSLVLAAQGVESPDASEALHKLCERYWRPLYIYVRKQGYDLHAAEDLTQGFFEKLLGTESWRNLDKSKGRLRSFLLQSMRYYIANMAERESRQKRGGGKVFVMDVAELEAELTNLSDRQQGATPDVLYDRRWATEVLDHVMHALGKDYEARGKGDVFAILGPHIPDKGDRGDTEQLACQLRIKPSDVRLQLYRLRKRYRERLRHEIAQTVATPEEVDDEIASLFQLFV